MPPTKRTTPRKQKKASIFLEIKDKTGIKSPNARHFTFVYFIIAPAGIVVINGYFFRTEVEQSRTASSRNWSPGRRSATW